LAEGCYIISTIRYTQLRQSGCFILMVCLIIVIMGAESNTKSWLIQISVTQSFAEVQKNNFFYRLTGSGKPMEKMAFAGVKAYY
jgi:hypothetical protein